MTRIAILLLLCSACTSIDKPAPADDPTVDDVAADSLRAPTLRGSLAIGSVGSDDLDGIALYQGWTLTLRAGESIDLRAGGVAQDGSILDTVLYLYGPKDAAGRRGSYLRRNDDRNSGDTGSRTRFVATRTGEYLVVVTTYTKPDPGHYAVQVACGGGCAAPGPVSGPRPPARVDTQPAANPELLAYIQLHFGAHWNPNATWPRAHVDALVKLLQNDNIEEVAVAASDAVYVDQAMLAAGSQLSATSQTRLRQALDGALGLPAAFEQRSARAQAVALDGLRWDSLAGAPVPASIDAVVAQLRQSWPGAQLDRSRVRVLARGGQVYGYLAEVGLSQRDAAGNQTLVWDGKEFFAADGAYLGDSSQPPSPPEAD